MTNNEVLTVRQAVVRLNCTIPYFYSLLHAQRMPGAHQIDGQWRVPAAAVDEYLTKRSRRSKSVLVKPVSQLSEAAAW